MTGKIYRSSSIIAGIILVLSLLDSNCQTTRYLDFTENNVEFLNIPTPDNGFYTRAQKTPGKSLYINSFSTNHALPVLAEDIYVPAGPIQNTFFGGDDPNMAGFGHVSAMALWDKKITASDFPISVEAEFFNRSTQPAYNESYFWIGNQSHEYFNPGLSTLPSPSIQEGLILGGIINRFLIQNGETPDIPSKKYYDFEHQANQMNEWYKMKAVIDINDDNKLVVMKVTINSVSVLSQPVVIDDMSYFHVNDLQLGICVDDFAKNFKVVFNHPIDDILSGKYNCGFVDTTLCYSNEAFPKVDFAISKIWESAGQVPLYQSPLLMDMDNDCIPEIVTSGLNDFLNNPRLTSGITIINTSNGQTKDIIDTPYYAWGGPTMFAVADLNMDAYPEIIVAAANVGQNPPAFRGRLLCYDAFGNLLWVSNDTYGKFTSTDGSGGAPAFADFNQDGIPEVYIYNEIFNALTGVKLTDGGFFGQGISSRSFNNFSYATSVAADLDQNPDDLELAAGYTIYDVVITNPEGTAGNVMVARPILLDNQYRDGHTSVADINLDGRLDVIVSSQGNQSTSRLYVYHLLNGSPVLIAQTAIPATGGGCCTEACSIAFVGDILGNGKPVIGVTRAYLLLTYQYDGTSGLKELWRLPTNDESGSTGMTMFDFNQDGTQEIVYRDENELRIINGSVLPPRNLASFSCTSGTGAEYPIVGDIDFSGTSKICVPCASGNSRTTGKIHVFGAPGGQQQWAPSRGIWNQYTYHVFNIKDDLTVPRSPLRNATFSNRRFNNFLVQASLLDTSGNYLQTSTDLTGAIQCLYYDDVSKSYSVRFEVSNNNTATAAFSDSLHVVFYSGNPLSGGIPVGKYELFVPIPPGRKLYPLEFNFSGFTVDTLYMIINTSGKVITQPSTQIEYFKGECDYVNNIAKISKPRDIITSRNQICQGDSIFFEGNWYTQSGTYTAVRPSAIACDTILRLILDVKNNTVQSLKLEACSGDSVFINPYWFTKDTTVSFTMTNSFGCDSVVEYKVQFFMPETIHQNIETCQGDSVFIKNKWYYDDIFLSDTIAMLPCPEYTTFKARFNSVYRFKEQITICPGDTAILHGKQFTEGGLFTIPFTTSAGCDSVYSLQIYQVSSPEEPVFTSDCQNRTYTGEILSSADWSFQWDNGSISNKRLIKDSLSGYVEFYHDTPDCLIKYTFNLETIPDTAPLLNLQDSVVFPGKPVFIDLGLDSSIWNVLWTPREYINCDSCFSNILILREDKDFLINLLHISGCRYVYPFRIEVDENIDIIIPNIFSPDAVGPNRLWNWYIPDCFKVLKLMVFDRWGNLVFEQNNTNLISWDGYFTGQVLEQGVYTFWVQYERPDGSIVKKSGDVTLIRL